MNNQQQNRPVICFGEILWDQLPGGKRPGGAPMNVAYHLHQLGYNSRLISCVGEDQPGLELLDFLSRKGLPTDLIQSDAESATSEVLASVDHNSHEVTYEILYPVAWDFIRWQPEFDVLLKSSKALVYGSLSARNNSSRETLHQLLEHANYRVFDVNLRAPHYSREVIDALLQKSDLVKLNASELMLISNWYDPACQKEADAVELLFNRFPIKEVLITKGSQGASYYTPSFRYDYPAYAVNVADTIGSGDSFLAAFLAMRLENEPVELTLDYAVAMGAFITSQSGACPTYSKSDFNRFIWKKKLNFKE